MTATATATAAGSASSTPTAAPAATAKPTAAPALPARWEGFPGPNVTPRASKPSFLVLPFQGKGWGDTVYIAAVDPLRVDGTALVVQGSSAELFIPGALVAAQSKRSPKVGDFVLVAFAVSINSSVLPGVVSDVTEDGGKKGYVVKYVLNGVDERTFPEEKLHVLDGTLGFGEKVAYRANDDKEWTVGTYVGPAPEGHWVVHFTQLVQRKEVKHLPLKLRKKGERVWAESGGTSSYSGPTKKESWRTLDPAVVKEVLDGGAAYRVQYDKDEDGKSLGNDDITHSFEELHTPFDKSIKKK